MIWLGQQIIWVIQPNTSKSVCSRKYDGVYGPGGYCVVYIYCIVGDVFKRFVAGVCFVATFARRENSVLRQRTCAEQLSHVTSGDVIAELPPRLTGLWLSTRSVL